MTPTQALYLDYAINACFWLTWLGLAASVIHNHRIGSN